MLHNDKKRAGIDDCASSVLLTFDKENDIKRAGGGQASQLHSLSSSTLSSLSLKFVTNEDFKFRLLNQLNSSWTDSIWLLGLRPRFGILACIIPKRQFYVLSGSSRHYESVLSRMKADFTAQCVTLSSQRSVTQVKGNSRGAGQDSTPVESSEMFWVWTGGSLGLGPDRTAC